MTDTIRRDDRDGIAVLAIDHPDRAMNVVDEAVLTDLEARVEEVLADEAVEALVLTSAKEGSFGAGADVSWLPQLAAREDAADFLAGVHELMIRLVRSRKPFVAAINGAAFGGALELALAAQELVAVADARLGLPEVTLGLLPGGGGTQLVGRFVGLETAAELLTSGRHLTAEEAHEAGLVTEVAAPSQLLERAVARARALLDAPTGRAEVAVADDAAAVVAARREELTASRRGCSRAAGRVLQVLEVGAREGLVAGLAAERASFLELLRSPEAKAAIHLFEAEGDVRRRSRGDGSTIGNLGVVGAGQMGAGIAATAVSRGLSATVKDVDDEALERARGVLTSVLARTAPADGADPRFERWRGTTDDADLAGTEAVIEAVFELPELKQRILGDLAATVRDDALVATNTSAISIASLAGSVTRSERFLGMHFFSPVDRMPLVELIPHAGTSAEATARAAAIVRQLGKVPVVVGDAPGFFTSRVYARWLIEGVRLLLDGAAVDEVDAAAKAAGFPVGPLQAHDEATLQLVLQASITQVADNVMADRIDVAAVREALSALVEAGATGRRYGQGFYTYGEDGRRRGPNPLVATTLGVEPAPIARDLVTERLLLAFATECFLCWDDGTLCHPDDGDVASVLGIGFPRVLGGPCHWADEQGAEHLLARTEALGAAVFPAGDALARFAADGGSFGTEPRRPAPFAPAGSQEGAS